LNTNNATNYSFYGANAVLIDGGGSWNATAYGNYSFSADHSGSMVFDGSSAYVDLGIHAFNSSFTVGFWAKISYIGYYGSLGTPIVSIGTNNEFNNTALFTGDAGGLRVVTYGTVHGYYGMTTASFAPAPDTWYYYIVSVDILGDINVYVNGTLVMSVAPPTISGNGNNKVGPQANANLNYTGFYLGKSPYMAGVTGGDTFFKGQISDFVLFQNTTLSAWQVLEVTNNQVRTVPTNWPKLAHRGGCSIAFEFVGCFLTASLDCPLLHAPDPAARALLGSLPSVNDAVNQDGYRSSNTSPLPLLECCR